MKPLGAFSLAAALTAGLVTLGLAVAANAAGSATPIQPPLRAAASGPASALALPQDMTPMFMPVILNPLSTPINLANGSFEADTSVNFSDPWPFCHYTGFTDQPKGNQHPSGWTYYSPAAGQPLPFPTKMQQGAIVPAISGGPGENVHKCTWMLPDNERLGQPRGLILAGDWTYKAFNDGNPTALQLSQTLTGTPGRTMQVTGYILGETPDKPTNPLGKLEDDHFIGSLQLGSASDTRFYAAMIQVYDVPGNERHWNKFIVSEVVPPSGQLLLTVTIQQNWAGETDFFLDDFTAVEWSLN
jgi:hypothetical protein